MKHVKTLCWALLVPISSFAQVSEVTSNPGQQMYIPQKGEFEVFMGAELRYRDISHEAQYEALIHLTPGIKWHLPHHILLAAQAQIPIVNNYGDYYKNPRLNVLTVSQQYRLGQLALKPSVGLFSQERYGVDVKAMYPLKPWVALEAQVGVTGLLSMAQGWQMSNIGHVMALAGADFYLSRWNTQIRVIGGEFLYQDWGFYAEGMRHFLHCTVGVYAEYSTAAARANGFNGGFKITMAIPPYKRTHQKVTFRPANHFLLSANMNAEPQTNKTYYSDPEENSRHGWFSPDILPWGANLMYDFKEKGGGK